MKKALQIIISFVSFFIFLVGILIIILAVIGIKPMIITSGSMKPQLPIGSICWINTNYPIDNINVNDIIVYQGKDQKIIHRVIKIEDHIIKTKGDANQFVDGASITKENYIGKYIFSINRIGFLAVQLETQTGKTIFVTTIIVIYVLQYLMNYAMKKDK